MTRILVVEDDATMAKLISSDLELEGYTVQIARDGEAGLTAAQKSKPDLIILDVMMPKMNGYDVCRALRSDKNDTPILMLTSKGQEADKVIGLNLGADDYLTKPFGQLEFMARVKALLRRHQRALDKIEQSQFGDVEIDFKKMDARKAGQAIHLTAKEFQLLELLLRYRGEVVSRRTFLNEIWGFDEMPSTRTVDNQVLTLRQKLGDQPNGQSWIATVHGSGYKFVG